jgi:hypothetical protein
MFMFEVCASEDYLSLDIDFTETEQQLESHTHLASPAIQVPFFQRHYLHCLHLYSPVSLL